MTQVDRLLLKKPYYKTKHSVRKDGSLNGLVVLVYAKFTTLT